MLRFFNQNLPIILSLSGAVLTALGIFLATVRQKREKIDSANQRAKFESELRLKSDEIARKSDEIAKLTTSLGAFLTGGNSYCYLIVANLNIDNTPGEGILGLYLEGNYPLYDVTMTIVDLTASRERRERNEHNWRNLNEDRKTLNLGNIHGLVTEISTLSLGNKERRDFNVLFHARNGSWTQKLRFRFVNGKWNYATRVFVPPAVEPVFEQIQPGYPREEDGSIKWD